MKNRTRSLLTIAGAFALVANGALGVAAQDRKQEGSVQKTETRYFIQQDGKTFTVQSGGNGPATFNLHVPEPGSLSGATWIATSGQEIGLGGSTFQFFSSEMAFDARLVTNAPFSAETVSETIQTLADGNRIVQRTEGRAFRDSQGRTRNERTFKMGGSTVERQTITIFDPVANVNYILDPATRTARKTISFSRVLAPPPPSATSGSSNSAEAGQAPKKITVSGGVLQGSAIRRVQPPYPSVAKAARASGAVQVQVSINEAGEVVETSVVSGHPLLRDAAEQAAKQWQFKPTELGGNPVKAQGILTFNFTLADEESALPSAGIQSGVAGGFGTAGRVKLDTNTEQLGKQVMEGVECEGTRMTTTFPAGALGNEAPIKMVRESWYSPELKMTVMTKQSDPRFGESTYRVTSIVRAEPDASLFVVPNDYTIKEGGSFSFGSPGQGPGIGFGGAWTGELPARKPKPDQQ